MLVTNRSATGTLTFSGEVFAIKLDNPSVIEKKTYLYKIYDESNTFVGVWGDVIDTPHFSQEINTQGSVMEIELARNSDSFETSYENLLDSDSDTIDDYIDIPILTSVQGRSKVGSGSNVQHNYRVDVYVFTVRAPRY